MAAVANGLVGHFVRLLVCGTFYWWHCNDARGSICNGPGGFNPCLANVVDRALFEIAGSSLSRPAGGVPTAVHKWCAMLTTKARLVRADKGISCLCPIRPVGFRGIRVRWRGYKGPMGKGSGGCIGGRKFGNGWCWLCEAVRSRRQT